MLVVFGVSTNAVCHQGCHVWLLRTPRLRVRFVSLEWHGLQTREYLSDHTLHLALGRPPQRGTKSRLAAHAQTRLHELTHAFVAEHINKRLPLPVSVVVVAHCAAADQRIHNIKNRQQHHLIFPCIRWLKAAVRGRMRHFLHSLLQSDTRRAEQATVQERRHCFQRHLRDCACRSRAENHTDKVR